MPIKPENKDRYPKNWKQISERIRFVRAANKCEVCGIRNGLEGWRIADGTFYSVDDFSDLHIKPKDETEVCNLVAKKPPIKIVLTVAHLDHTPENCDDDNLKAMCQRCHNRYDQPHRKANARQTRVDKKGQISLFA